MTHEITSVAEIAREGALVELVAVPGMDEERDGAAQRLDRPREAARAAAQTGEVVAQPGAVGLALAWRDLMRAGGRRQTSPSSAGKPSESQGGGLATRDRESLAPRPRCTPRPRRSSRCSAWRGPRPSRWSGRFFLSDIGVELVEFGHRDRLVGVRRLIGLVVGGGGLHPNRMGAVQSIYCPVVHSFKDREA